MKLHNVAGFHLLALLCVNLCGVRIRELSLFGQHNPVARLAATVTHAEGELVQVGVRTGRDGVGGGFHAVILHHPGWSVNPDTQQINLFIPSIFPLDRFRIS